MEDDKQFYEDAIEKVEPGENGNWVHLKEGYCIFVQPYDGSPRAGDTVRFYGKQGIGCRYRGLIIGGKIVFYRTASEDEEWHEIQLYGRDAQDWLERWDAGKSVWSIEMGGLGPGYEQAIQVTIAEIIRHMLSKNYIAESWEDKSAWKEDLEKIEQWSHKDETIKKLGLSGAQWGAAMNVATNLYRRGPRSMMTDKRVKDRHIQISKNFP